MDEFVFRRGWLVVAAFLLFGAFGGGVGMAVTTPAAPSSRPEVVVTPVATSSFASVPAPVAGAVKQATEPPKPVPVVVVVTSREVVKVFVTEQPTPVVVRPSSAPEPAAPKRTPKPAPSPSPVARSTAPVKSPEPSQAAPATSPASSPASPSVSVTVPSPTPTP